MSYLFAQRHMYRQCMEMCRNNPDRFPETAKLSFRDWIELPF